MYRGKEFINKIMVSFNLSLSTNRLKNDFERFQDNVNKSDKVYSNISLEEETKLRFISSQNFNDYKFSIGGNIQYSNYSNNTLYPFYEINYNTSFDLIKYGFLQSQIEDFNDKLGVSLGVRVDQDNFTIDNNLLKIFHLVWHYHGPFLRIIDGNLILQQEDISRYQHTQYLGSRI